MCGIVGFITEDNKLYGKERIKFMHQALIAGILRGDDSTGVFWSGGDFDLSKNAGWCKSATDGYSFVHGAKYATTERDIEKAGFCIGHNRAATVGRVCTDNAHPFSEGPVTMVHNGTLYDTRTLPHTAPSHYVVDSQELAWNLGEAEVDGAKEVIESILGAFALVWHDARDGSLNFVRNDERPLHFAHSKYSKTIYIASESHMLAWLGRRMRLGFDSVYSLEVGKWLKFTDNSLKPRVKEVEVDSWGAWNQYGGSYYGRGKRRAGAMYQTPASSPSRSSGNTSNPPSSTNDPNAIKVGDRWRSIPDLLQDSLLALGLSVQDRLYFQPEHAIPGHGGWYSMVGYIPSLKIRARVNNLTGYHVGEVKQRSRDFIVRPVALRADEEMPELVAYFCHTCDKDSYEMEKFTLVAGQADTPAKQDGREPEDDLGVPTYPGPDALMLTADDWLELTSDGCSLCGSSLPLVSSDSVKWFDGEPVCAPCVEHYRDLVLDADEAEGQAAGDAA